MNKLLYLTLIIFIVTSCSIKPVDNFHGVAFLEKKQKKLSINKSNKNDIIKVLGAPSTESVFDDDLWIYIESRKSKSSLLKLGKEIIISNNVLVLEIDNKGVLKSKTFYNLNDINKINFNKNKTQMSDKDSFVYSVMSSLRQKINNSKK